MCGSPRLCRRRKRCLFGARFGGPLAVDEDLSGKRPGSSKLTLRYLVLGFDSYPLRAWVDPSPPKCQLLLSKLLVTMLC